MKQLRTLNASRPVHMLKTPDELAEKLLPMLVASTSSAVGLEAQKELEAVAGAPGVPGVRQFQNPNPAAGNLRSTPLLVSHFQKMFSSAFRAGHIAKSVPTKCVKPGSTAKLAQMQDEIARLGRLGSTAWEPNSNSEKTQSSLSLLSESGFIVSPGSTTTSDFRSIPEGELCRIADGETAMAFFAISTRITLSVSRTACVFPMVPLPLSTPATAFTRSYLVFTSCICANFAVEPGFTHLVGTDLAIWPARNAELNIF